MVLLKFRFRDIFRFRVGSRGRASVIQCLNCHGLVHCHPYRLRLPAFEYITFICDNFRYVILCQNSPCNTGYAPGQFVFQYGFHLRGIGVDGQYLAVAIYEEAAASGIANAVFRPDAETVVKLQEVEPRVAVAPYRRFHCICIVILASHAHNGESTVFILVIHGNKLLGVYAARRAPTAPEVNQGHTPRYLL